MFFFNLIKTLSITKYLLTLLTYKQCMVLTLLTKPYSAYKTILTYNQGHPMDLFLKISVLHANFCWLGDVEEIIVLGRKVLLGKR